MADKLTLSIMKNISDLALDKTTKTLKEKYVNNCINIDKSEETLLKGILLKSKNKVKLNDLKVIDYKRKNNREENNREENNREENNKIELKTLSSLSNKSEKVNDIKKSKNKMITLKELSK